MIVQAATEFRMNLACQVSVCRSLYTRRRGVTALLGLWCVEKHIVCLWGLSELVISLYMLVSFCSSDTRFRFGGQSVHMRKDREMLSLGRLYNKDSDVHAVLRQSKVR